MEFPFDLHSILHNEISIITKSSFKNPATYFSANYVNYNIDRSEFKLSTIIDKLGEASAKAQGLTNAITTTSKLINSDHRLYIIKEPSSKNQVVGLLKVGCKNLFLSDQPQQLTLREFRPLCVLDFYMVECRQRRGFGHRLFSHMLQIEGKEPGQLALDRPSCKLLAFMERHFGLAHPIGQLNSYVVFPVFFTSNTPVEGRRQHCNKELENWSPSINDISSESGWSPPRTVAEYSRIYYSPQSRAKHKYFRRSLPPNNSCQSSSWNVLGVPPPDYLH